MGIEDDDFPMPDDERIAREMTASFGRRPSGGYRPLRGIEKLAVVDEENIEGEPERIRRIAREEIQDWENIGNPFRPDDTSRPRIPNYEARFLKKYLKDLCEAAKENTLVKAEERFNKETGETSITFKKAGVSENHRKEIIRTVEDLQQEILIRTLLHNAMVDWMEVRPSWQYHYELLTRRGRTTLEGDQLVELARMPEIGPQINDAMTCLVAIALSRGFPHLLEGMAHEYGGVTSEELKNKTDSELKALGIGDGKSEVKSVSDEKLQDVAVAVMLRDENDKLTPEQKRLIHEVRTLKLKNIFADPPRKMETKKVYKWIQEQTGANEATIELAIKIFCITNLAADFGIENNNGMPNQATNPLTPDITGHGVHFQIKELLEGEYDKSDEDKTGECPIGGPGLFMTFPGLSTNAFKDTKVETNKGKKTLWELWWNRGIPLGELPVGDITESMPGQDRAIKDALAEEGITGIAVGNWLERNLIYMYFAGKLKEAITTAIWTNRDYCSPEGFRKLNKATKLIFPNKSQMYAARITLAAAKLRQRLSVSAIINIEGEATAIAPMTPAGLDRNITSMIKTGYLRKSDEGTLRKYIRDEIPKWQTENLERLP